MTRTDYIVDAVNKSLMCAARPAVIADMKKCALCILELTACIVNTFDAAEATISIDSWYTKQVNAVIQKHILHGATGLHGTQSLIRLRDQIDDIRIHLIDTIQSIGITVTAFNLPAETYSAAVNTALMLAYTYLKKPIKSINSAVKFHCALDEISGTLTKRGVVYEPKIR